MKTVRVVSLLPLLLAAMLVSAQTFRGGIQGTVMDTSGAAVAGAQVTAASPDTNLTRTAQTSDSGDYAFTELPPGNYNLTVIKQGFSKKALSNVQVAVSSNTHADVTLSPGEVRETVEVQADIPVVETTSDNMGGIIGGETAAALPVNGRDFTKLLVLVPGATGDPSGAADSPGSFGLFSMNGNRGRSNNYLLDGTDMNDGYRNLPAINQGGVFGTPATILPMDALAEVPVLSNTEAEYGRNSGAVVNLVTKSGTNNFHGSLYEYFRNNALDARNYFNTVDQKRGRIPQQSVRRLARRSYHQGQDILLCVVRRAAGERGHSGSGQRTHAGADRRLRRRYGADQSGDRRAF